MVACSQLGQKQETQSEKQIETKGLRHGSGNRTNAWQM
jgi:hypothetical protein